MGRESDSLLLFIFMYQLMASRKDILDTCIHIIGSGQLEVGSGGKRISTSLDYLRPELE